MYDARNEAREFFAESRDEAIAKAAQFFGLEAEALTIHEPPELSVAGLGGRVVIVARPQGAPAPSRPERREGRGREGREREGRGEGRSSRREGRGGEGRGRREGRERGEGRGRDRAPRERLEERREAVAEAEGDREPVESRGTAEGELGPTGEYLLGIIERMGLGDFTVAATREGDVAIYHVRGDAARELGSGDGRGVDALQLLANQAEMRRNDEPAKIVVDAEGDPERREGFLTRLAERAARRALDSGRSVALDPMNGKDRRIIHVALRDAEGVATMSVGSGRYRQVVVVPEGSPEYEEARRVSEAAASGDGDE